MIRAGLLLLAAASPAAGPLAGRVPGAPVDCIELDRVHGPEIDGAAILYRQSGARVWRMTPLERCGALTTDTLIVAEVTGRRFCRGDRFQIDRRDTPAPVGYCRAGAFTPYDRSGKWWQSGSGSFPLFVTLNSFQGPAVPGKPTLVVRATLDAETSSA